MNTHPLDLSPSQVITGPTCKQCFGRTRLTGIEPHPTKAHTELQTYQCIACDAVQAVVVPIAQ